MVDIRRPDPKRDFAEGVSVWPEKNTEAMIDEVLAQVSAASAQKECFNNPVVEGTYFKEITWGAVPPLNKFPFLISYGDPAPSNRTTHRKGVKALGSFKSNVLLGILDGRLYVITAFLKAMSPMMSSSIGTTTKRITSATVRRSTTTSRITSYRIPSTIKCSSRFSFKRPLNGNSSSLSHPTSELNRINSPELKATSSRSTLGGQPDFQHRRKRESPHATTPEEQFKLFDDGLPAPADGPDAVEGGYFVAQRKVAAITPTAWSIGTRPVNKKRY